jgi:OST-HTH/LOTUS domain
LAQFVPGTVVVGSGTQRTIKRVDLETASFEQIRTDILRMLELAKRRGRVVTSSDVGMALATLYPGEKKVNKRFGFASLLKMISAISEIEVRGDGPHRELSIREK